jgi:hypothetical protein
MFRNASLWQYEIHQLKRSDSLSSLRTNGNCMVPDEIWSNISAPVFSIIISILSHSLRSIWLGNIIVKE